MDEYNVTQYEFSAWARSKGHLLINRYVYQSSDGCSELWLTPEGITYHVNVNDVQNLIDVVTEILAAQP